MASSMHGGSGLRGGSGGDVVPSGYRKGRIQNFDSQQMGLYNSMYGDVGEDSYLSKLAGGDEDIFNQIEAPALRQFNELQGGMASRFSGMGTGGRQSSGFQNEMNQASSNFAQDLQANRMSLRNQAIKDLMGMSDTLLNQRPQENFLVEKQQDQGNWGNAATGTLKGAATGFAMGGPWGAVGGGLVGGYGGYHGG